MLFIYSKPRCIPSVVSDAGEPASPQTAAIRTNNIMALGENPSFIANGTYIVEIIGTVPNEVPIPKVTNRPSKIITYEEISFEPPKTPAADSNYSSIAPEFVITFAYPAANSITNAINPIM